MLILSEKDIYSIKYGLFAMNRKLEKLMAAEQLDIDAIINELDNNLQNGTNPYIIWDRLMHECVKAGCTITEKKNIELPTLFLKNGRELRSDLIAKMNWCKTGFCEDGKPRFESRFSFWLGELSCIRGILKNENSFEHGFEHGFSTKIDYEGVYTKGVCGTSLALDCNYFIPDISQIKFFIQNFWNYVACVEDVVKRAHECVNDENKKLIQEAANGYET